MAIKLYMDVHIKSAVTDGMRRRGVDVLTAQESKLGLASDEEHIEFARGLGRVIFTNDVDYLRLHAQGAKHAGIIYCHQTKSIGQMIQGLILVYELMTPEQMANHVEFI
jgi:predicted nuclease of predicted toxin-antitoxin system